MLLALHQPPTLLLELMLTQQLHQLTSASSGPASATGAGANQRQFVHGLLAGRGGVSSLTVPKNPSVQASMLQSLNANQQSNLNSLAQRDAAAFLLMVMMCLFVVLASVCNCFWFERPDDVDCGYLSKAQVRNDYVGQSLRF